VNPDSRNCPEFGRFSYERQAPASAQYEVSEVRNRPQIGRNDGNPSPSTRRKPSSRSVLTSGRCARFQQWTRAYSFSGPSSGASVILREPGRVILREPLPCDPARAVAPPSCASLWPVVLREPLPSHPARAVAPSSCAILWPVILREPLPSHPARAVAPPSCAILWPVILREVAGSTPARAVPPARARETTAGVDSATARRMTGELSACPSKGAAGARSATAR